MAKDKKPSKKIGGPFLAAAFLCENIVEDKEGSISAIRLLDKMTLRFTSASPVPSKKNKVSIKLSGLISFRSGDAGGKHALRIVFVSPSQEEISSVNKEMVLGEEPNGGANVILQTGLAIAEEGVYWLDVHVDGRMVTRMPLHVEFEMVAETTNPGA